MKKYSVIGSASILFLFLGLIYAWSIFTTPLETEFGWTRNQSSFTFTISIIAFCVGALSASPLLKRLNPTIILICMGILILCGLLICANLKHILQLYIFYGWFCGFATGCAYSTLLTIIPLWFPKHIGLANGVGLLAFGVGSLLLSSILTALINSSGWRNAFRILGIVATIIFLLFSFFITRPNDKKLENRPIIIGYVGEVNTLWMLKRVDFWLYFFWLTMISAMGLAIIGHAAPIAEDTGLETILLPLAVGCMSVCSGLGRLVSGFLYDRFGSVITLHIETILGFLGCGFVLLACIYNQPALLFIGYVFAGLSFGSVASINASFVRTRYGSRFFTANFAMMSFSLIPAAVVGTYVSGVIRANSQNYLSSVLIAIFYVLISLIISLRIRKLVPEMVAI